jgi:2,4-dienoyl-CoA reductase-like NADH-dependent reductase (Old Yellow Enzyme family)/NADPH-dependent 2,4-dienoyl-CoA reductase/sulfur reductase-like enzyme
MKYKKLFEKYSIGNMQLKNRIVMPPMATFMGKDNLPSDELAAYYGARAKGGFALICIEHTCVTQVGLYGPRILRAFPKSCIPSWKKMFDEIHKYGSKVAVQLGDGGTSARIEVNGGQEPISASSTPDHVVRRFPHEVSLKGIEKYKEAYLHAVDNMVEAGADAIILHFANGYFLASFLSTRENKRTDKYGGTMEGRLRLPMEIIKDIRRKYGNNITLLARIGAFEERHGRTVDETMVIAKALEEAGVEAISFNAGSYFEMNYEIPTYSQPQGYIMDEISKLKKGLNIPVLGGGRVTEPLLADSYLRDGRVDLIELGRGSIADPEWPNKAQSGESDNIHRCIGCCRCCEGADLEKGCSVNPYAFRELKYEGLPKKSESEKDVLVIGGGIAGLQAAVIAAKKGHNVKVIEKNPHLGGMAKVASMPIDKGEIVSMVTSLEADARLYGVEIKLNTEVDSNYVEAAKPDVVIVATGSKSVPCTFVKGYEEAGFIDAVDLLKGTGMKYIPIDAKFAVIGGGAIGIEIAEFLSVYENSVDVYEMSPELGMNFKVNLSDQYLLRFAKKRGVNINLGHKAIAVENNSLIFEVDGQKKTSDKYDYFVSAIGLQSENTIVKSLEDSGYSPIVIGDAKEPSRFKEVIEEAFIVGNSIE